MKKIAVIGAGLSGGCVAWSLARRGANVTIFETEHPAAKASGNRDAILAPYLTDKKSVFSELYGAGFELTLKLLDTLQKDSPLTKIIKSRGALQMPSTNRLQKIFQSPSQIEESRWKIMNQKECEDVIQNETVSGGFFCETARIVSMKDLVDVLIRKSEAKLRSGTKVASLERNNDSWCVIEAGHDGESFDAVVICSAYEAASFPYCNHIPLEPVRGETWLLPASKPIVPVTIMTEGYLTPADPESNLHLLGGSFLHGDFDKAPRLEELTKLLIRFDRWIPNLLRPPDSAVQSRVCFRTSTHDRLPYVGAIPQFDAFKSEATTFRSGTNILQKVHLSYFPSLYISAGHGSRGLTTCPLSAEIIGRLIHDESLEDLKGPVDFMTPDRLLSRVLAA